MRDLVPCRGIRANSEDPCTRREARRIVSAARRPGVVSLNARGFFRPKPHVMIRTMLGREPLDTVNSGTLAGAGCFRCEECGFAVALHERDEIPPCPHCGGEAFRRASI